MQVQLPDDKDYEPALEFVVLDEPSGLEAGIIAVQKFFTFGGATEGDNRRPVVWGTIPLSDFHPCGPDIEVAADDGGE